MNGPATVGWCPGALRPMASGDGLIVRVKPSGGRLTLDQAEGVARLALRHGNGRLDLTGRANLQIRGVAPAGFDALVAGLDGLGLLDGSAVAEAIRNIVVSPLAGLDPAAADLWPLLRALERRLAADEGLRSLPAKWGVTLDDGGALPLDAVAADVRILLGRDGGACLRLDGLDEAAVIAADAVPDLVSHLGRLCAGRRVRDLVAARGHRLFGELGLAPTPRAADRRPAATLDRLLGDHTGFVGFAPAFGGLEAPDLVAAVTALRAAGGRELRLTPWRTLLAPAVADRVAALRILASLHFILRADDPRLMVTACVGAPACHRATTPTRLHAERLAGQGAGPIHVSGCAKGCGQTGAAAWTLVGHDGCYDLVPDGTARDAPATRGLPFAEAAARLSRAGQARTA